MRKDPELYAIVLILVLMLGGVFTGMILSEAQEGRTARTCIEQGFEWVDDSCIRK